MNLLKKIFVCFTVLTVAASLFITANAQDFVMRIDTVTVPAGTDSQVIVPVYIDSMPDGMNLSCFAWEFYFDEQNIQLAVSREPADFAGELITDTSDCTMGKVATIDGSQGKFRFGWTTTASYITNTGVAMYLPFNISAQTMPGTYNIVADAFGDIRSGTQSYISSDDIQSNPNTYLLFGAIVVTDANGESGDYNDYEYVASRADFYTFEKHEDTVVSGTVDNGKDDNTISDNTSGGTSSGSDSSNDTPSSGSSSGSSSGGTSSSGSSGGSSSGGSSSGGTSSNSSNGNTSSSDDSSDKDDGSTNEPSYSETVEAGTMVTYHDSYVEFNTIKSQSGYVICALYKGSSLVGYSIQKSDAGKKVSVKVDFSDIPDTAVTVLMRSDGTLDCYGKYPVTVSEDK